MNIHEGMVLVLFDSLHPSQQLWSMTRQSVQLTTLFPGQA